ncbi:MAG: M48 family metalloprotease [Spirochaetota bacterium]|nr:M48 family metalloprotease [Spirochaetota bacterium]
MMKIVKIKYLIYIYILSLLIIGVFGFFGNNNNVEISYALKYFSRNDLDVGRSYFLFGMIPSTVSNIIGVLLLLYIAANGHHSRFSAYLSTRYKSDLLQVSISFAYILSILACINFPFALLTGFIRKDIFGLMNTDLFTWLARYFSATLIYLLLICVSLSILAIVIIKTKRFIIHIPIAFFILSLIFTIIYPRLITPIFYNSTKLPDNELRIKINRLINRSDIDIEDIYVLNKSRYSSAINAYMTGIGADRRIYLYDTLVNNFEAEEILSVIGHELCHYIEEHMLLGIALGTVGIIIALPLLNILSTYFTGKDLKCIMRPEGHPFLLILLIFIIFISKPIGNNVSREMERRADEYTINITENPDTFIRMKTRMTRINRSYILPNPLFVWFYYTHPPILERIRIAEKYKQL